MPKHSAPEQPDAAQALAAAESDIKAKGLAAATAREVLDGLEAKLRHAQQREAALSSDRQDVSYAAHTGSAAAAEKLRAIHTAAGEIGSEIASLESAVAEAARRMGAAEREQRHAVERRYVRGILSRLDDCRGRGQDLDKEAETFFRNLGDTFGMLTDLAVVGPGHPTLEQVQVMTMRAIKSHGMSVRHIIGVDMLPPESRVTLSDLLDSWSRAIGDWAERRLAELGEAA
jgi:hypothetical protein